MRITEGSYYKRRDGKIVGPVKHTNVSFSDENIVCGSLLFISIILFLC
jgi:hypothetical protein